MKLLNPSEVQDLKAQQLARDAMRVRDMSKATDEARKRLANAEADFQQMLAGQQLRWSREQEDYNKEVAERQKELGVLEERRQKALEPVKLVEERARKTLHEAHIGLQGVQKREHELDDLKELLEGKLDAVGAREQDVLTREQKASALEKNLEAQQRISEDNMAFVGRALKDLNARKKLAEQEVIEKQKALFLKERSLEAWSARLTLTQDKLAVWDKQLADQRGTLERELIRISEREKKV